MILKHSEYIVGFRIDEMPGPSLLEKANHLNSLSAADVHTLAAKIGFEVVVKAGSIIVIPAGFMFLVIASSEGTSGMRWGLSITHGDTIDTPTVLSTISTMIAAYPDQATGPLGQFKAAIE